MRKIILSILVGCGLGVGATAFCDGQGGSGNDGLETTNAHRPMSLEVQKINQGDYVTSCDMQEGQPRAVNKVIEINYTDVKVQYKLDDGIWYDARVVSKVMPVYPPIRAVNEIESEREPLPDYRYVNIVALMPSGFVLVQDEKNPISGLLFARPADHVYVKSDTQVSSQTYYHIRGRPDWGPGDISSDSSGQPIETLESYDNSRILYKFSDTHFGRAETKWGYGYISWIASSSSTTIGGVNVSVGDKVDFSVLSCKKDRFKDPRTCSIFGPYMIQMSGIVRVIAAPYVEVSDPDGGNVQWFSIEDKSTNLRKAP